MYMADLFTHESNATAEVYFRTNTNALTEQRGLEAKMHDREHLGHVEDAIHDKFHSANIGSITPDAKPLKHSKVNACKPAFPKGDVKVAFCMNASATYRDQTPLQCVSDTVSVGGEPLNKSVKEIYGGIFTRLVQVRE
jgi:hypothetical protein